MLLIYQTEAFLIQQNLLENVYSERKKKNLSMIELHDVVLGTETWDIFRPLIDFVSSSSNKPGILSHYITEKNEGQMDEIQNSWLPEVKKYDCVNLDTLGCMIRNDCEIEDTAGLLLSPGFPQDYQSNVDCGWKLIVPAGSYLTLQFWAFDIEVKNNDHFKF